MNGTGPLSFLEVLHRKVPHRLVVCQDTHGHCGGDIAQLPVREEVEDIMLRRLLMAQPLVVHGYEDRISHIDHRREDLGRKGLVVPEQLGGVGKLVPLQSGCEVLVVTAAEGG